MATLHKMVRFYVPRVLDQSENSVLIADGFWRDLRLKLADMTPAQREHTYNGVTYCGHSATALSPATPYIYVGRLRPPADRPDTYRRDEGIVGPLMTAEPDDEISEPTYLLPFGAKNYVAIMSPRMGATRSSALEQWVTAMCDMEGTQQRVELTPLLDETALRKLDEAIGVSRLEVRVAGSEVVDPRGGGEVGQAISEATAAAGAEMTVDLVWSIGHARLSDGRHTLRDAALWILSKGVASKLKLSIQVPEGDGFRTEPHDMLLDRVAFPIALEVAEGQVASETVVLTGMNDAIETFRRRA